MKKFNLRTILFLIFFLSFLSSCQSIQDGLSGRKSENSDENSISIVNFFTSKIFLSLKLDLFNISNPYKFIFPLK